VKVATKPQAVASQTGSRNPIIPKNIHTLYATKDTPIAVVPAWNALSRQAVDVGGIYPDDIKYQPELKWDSWLTIGITEGEWDAVARKQAFTLCASTTGLDMNMLRYWSQLKGIQATDGCLRYADLNEATKNAYNGTGANRKRVWDPAVPVVLAQVTVPKNVTLLATLNLKGIDTTGKEYKTNGIVFVPPGIQPPCAAGSWRPRAGVPCERCKAGQFSPLGATACIKCGGGTADLDQNPETPCQACPAGSASVSPPGGATSCAACGDGMEDHDGNPKTACKACAAGRSRRQTSWSTKCTACAAGRYAPGLKTITCATCLPGAYAAPGGISCVKCPAGKRDHDSDPRTTCAQCGAGYYVQSGQTQCFRCDAAKLEVDSDSNPSTPCVKCPAGKVPDRAATACQAGAAPSCNAGHEKDSAGRCVQCKAGKADTDKSSATPCALCPHNSFSGIGATTCTACQPGEFSLDPSQPCRLCPQGTIWSANASMHCQQCAPGKADEDSNPTTPCSQCTAGRYSTVGSAVCRACPAGMADLDKSAATLCTACQPGRYSAPAAVTCPLCPKGEADADRNPATPCTACKTGSYAAAGSTACEHCPLGTHDEDNDATTPCTKMPTASFASASVGGAVSHATVQKSLAAALSASPTTATLAVRVADIVIITYTQVLSGSATFASGTAADFALSPQPGKMVRTFIQGIASVLQTKTTAIKVNTVVAATGRRRRLQGYALSYSATANKDVSAAAMSSGFGNALAIAMNAAAPGAVPAGSLTMAKPTIKTEATFVIATDSAAKAKLLNTQLNQVRGRSR
jgi:hypothetical protein